MRLSFSCLAAMVFVMCAQPAEPPGKLVRETWDAAFLNGEKAGLIHTTVVESKRGEQTVLRMSRELQLTVKRFGQVASLRAETGNEESPDGKLLGVFMVQEIAKDQQNRISGQVVNGVLQDTSEDPNLSPEQRAKRQKKLPDGLITLIGEETLLQKKKPKPGDQLSYRLFEPSVYDVVQVDIQVKGFDTLLIDGVNRKLLRALARPQQIEGVQLPSQTIWYDENFAPVLSQGEIPGLGELTLRRTTKEKALAPLGHLSDLGEQSVLLNRAIENPHQQSKIVYRVTFAREIEDLDKAFAVGDGRQSIQNVKAKSLDLVVTAVRAPPDKDSNELVNQEFLNSNFFINCTDELVRKHAIDAVGNETDPWRKAQLIERWVNTHMKSVAFTEAMATSDHVARELTGDCTEFAMLAAAMCRAQKVPSRTALGLVYYNDRDQAKLGYHMWTEVWIKGQWLAIDATLGYGSVGPAHIKITDHSWEDVRSMTPLLPVMRVMSGKPTMEVLQVEP
jgi:hypothetical protein